MAHVRTIYRSNRPGYLHPVSSELENSGIREAVGDYSVTERRRWRPPYQTGKTVHMHAKTLQTQRGRTHGAGCVRQCFRTAELLGERRYENWNTHTHTDTAALRSRLLKNLTKLFCQCRFKSRRRRLFSLGRFFFFLSFSSSSFVNLLCFIYFNIFFFVYMDDWR